MGKTDRFRRGRSAPSGNGVKKDQVIEDWAPFFPLIGLIRASRGKEPKGIPIQEYSNIYLQHSYIIAERYLGGLPVEFREERGSTAKLWLGMKSYVVPIVYKRELYGKGNNHVRERIRHAIDKVEAILETLKNMERDAYHYVKVGIRNNREHGRYIIENGGFTDSFVSMLKKKVARPKKGTCIACGSTPPKGEKSVHHIIPRSTIAHLKSEHPEWADITEDFEGNMVVICNTCHSTLEHIITMHLEAALEDSEESSMFLSDLYIILARFALLSTARAALGEEEAVELAREEWDVVRNFMINHIIG